MPPQGPVNTDIHDGVWTLEASASAVWYTNWRRNIASVDWGMGAWTRIGLKATIKVVSFPRAKALNFELEHNSTVSWHS